MPARPAAVCGTTSGYQRHRRNGETPCGECKEARAIDQRKRRGGQAFKPAECGTDGGYRRHLRQGERACGPCLKAHSEGGKPRRYWRQLWHAQGGICALCDQPVPHDAKAIHVDHIVPQSDEGDHHLSNLQVVHAQCNLVKWKRDNETARQLLLGQAA